MFVLCLEVVDDIKYISIFRELIGMLKIFFTKAKHVIPESMAAFEGFFGNLERGMKGVVVAAKIYFKRNYMQRNFSVACEVRFCFRSVLHYDRLPDLR